MKGKLILLVIILIATLLRVINLGSIPVGFNDDEAAFGYNAYSILKTGQDEWGRKIPFPVFESFGDWKLVGYLYMTVVPVKLFGLSEFSTRLPSVFFGVLAVFATYLLSKKLFNREIAYGAAFLLAISPWHIVASRNAFESDVLIFLITISVYFFLCGLQKSKYLLFSYLGFIAGFYIYRSSWIFVPLFILTQVYFFRSQIKKAVLKHSRYFIAITFLILPLVPVVLTFKGQSRFIQESFVSGTSKIGIINNINEKRGLCQTKVPGIVCRLIHNKYSYFANTYINNYLGNLSGATFFNKANPTGFQSFATRSVFYIFELPFLIAGLIFLFKKKDQGAKILLPWLLLAPVGASMVGIGNFGRINIIMPVPQIIEAFGFFSLFGLIKKIELRKVALIFVICVISISFLEFISELFLVEPYTTARAARYGYKELFNYLGSQENSYNQILISKKIDSSHQYIQYVFFQKVNPQYFIANANRPKTDNGWVDFESIGKYQFVHSIPEVPKIPKKTLGVVGENEVEYPIPPKFIIRDLRGDILFKIYDIDEVKEKLQAVVNNS